MVLTDNINILKANNPGVWELLEPYQEAKNQALFQVEETRRGDKTLAFRKEGSTAYLHSKYNPLKEAETIVESYKRIDKDTSVVFYGTGLGYHIRLILERYPNIKYYIYEPIPELMYNFLSIINLKELKAKRLVGMNIGQESDGNLERFVELNKDKLIIVELPSHKQNFQEEYRVFNEMFLNFVKDKRRSISINYSFQKRWVINSMKNFKEILSTPNIIMGKKGQFKGKPAILVAAGPSLNEEIENLRYIKENKLAYIFSVGSAVNTLIHHGIHPDATTTYDPTEQNQKVFYRIRNEKIKGIPLIFGTSGVFETVMNYPGEKYHMITNQDTVSDYYLKGEDNRFVDKIIDAPSIAVVTLQLLYQLGFGPIILVGQNLAYKGKERYSEGISYSTEVTEEEREIGIWIKDVDGNEILTDDGFNAMRMQMEHYIKEFPNLNVINTTKGGAHIEGTKFVALNELIEKELKDKIVEKNWLATSKKDYDKEYLVKQAEKMEKSYVEATKIIKVYYNNLDKMNHLTNNRNFKQVRKMYIKLGAQTEQIENNDYFKTFILPMNRVEHKMLIDNVSVLNGKSDDYQKGKKIVFTFKQFMDICVKDMEMIRPIYDEMKKALM